MSKPLRYIAYLRKSEVREDRQVLSIPAQKRAIQERFPDLNIIEFREETRSAFVPGRPIYDQTLLDIEEGRADGLIAWHPNRISRNEIDSARLTYALRKPLKDLRFCTYTFENTPEGIMMLQMIMNQSQYESSKQGRDVKRGMLEKVEGSKERPGVVPTGYFKKPVLGPNGELLKKKDNKLVTKTDTDPERIEHVRKMWRMLLSGVYTPREIRKIANEEWGYTLRATRKTGGGPIGLSTIYRMFTNPFYAGWIRHNGKLYKGDHEAVITLEEFDYAQKLLGKRGKPRLNAHEYAFTALIKCGECGCSIAGKTNEKFVKRENKIVTYVHYYCIRKSEKRPCSQTKYTRVEDLEAEIMNELAKYEILPEFRDLALSILKRDNALEVSDRQTTYKSQQKARNEAQQRLDGLVDMRLRGQLDDEEYEHQRSRYKQEIARLDSLMRGTEGRAEQWLELTERAFNFATYARYHFEHGDLKAKRDILMTLGQNLLLKNNKLTLEQSEWLLPIANNYPALEAAYLRKVGTNQKATSKELEVALGSKNETWRARRDSNPRHAA